MNVFIVWAPLCMVLLYFGLYGSISILFLLVISIGPYYMFKYALGVFLRSISPSQEHLVFYTVP